MPSPPAPLPVGEGSLTGSTLTPSLSHCAGEGSEIKPLSGDRYLTLPVRFFFPVVLCCSIWQPCPGQQSIATAGIAYFQWFPCSDRYEERYGE